MCILNTWCKPTTDIIMAAKKITAPGEPKFYSREHPELSERLSIAEFKKQCETLYRQYEVMVPKEDDLSMQLQVSADIYHEVESVCNIEQLKLMKTYQPSEGLSALKNKGVEGLPRDHNLQVIKNFQLTKDIITRKDEPSNYAPRRVHDSVRASDYVQQIQQPEVVLTVAVHHPFRQKKKDMEFQVLGSQPLTVLKDVIICQSDYLMFDDCSENPCEDIQKYVFELGKMRKDQSGFFFIDNTFYNDMRNSANEDYSKTIIEWASAPERCNTSPRLDRFESADMATTHFDQLIIRLGYPYLYCHQGNCEHLIMFTDVAMLHPDDCQDGNLYPLLVFQARARRRVCGICAIYTATWVTRHDELAAEDPAFYCESCFKMLHYSEDGSKLCNFRAYPYFDHIELVHNASS